MSGRPAEYPDGKLSLSQLFTQRCDKTGDTLVRINDLRKSPRDTGVRTGEDHLTEGPLDRVVMAAKGINQYTSTVVPPCLPAVVVKPFVDRKLQVRHNCPTALLPMLTQYLGLEAIEFFYQYQMTQQ